MYTFGLSLVSMFKDNIISLFSQIKMNKLKFWKFDGF